MVEGKVGHRLIWSTRNKTSPCQEDEATALACVLTSGCKVTADPGLWSIKSSATASDVNVREPARLQGSEPASAAVVSFVRCISS